MKNVWNKFTNLLGTTILHPQFIMRSYISRWMDLTPKYVRENVIDIGCGQSPYKKRLEKFATSYTGVDHPEIYRLTGIDTKPDISADAHSIPVKDRAYDCALILQSLEYMKDPQKVIKESSRVLKSGGVLIMTVPFMYPIHDAPYDRGRYTETQLKEFLSNADLKIIKLIRQGGFFDFWLQSLLVFWFKSAKGWLTKKNPFLLASAIFMTSFSLPIVVLCNLLALILRRVGEVFPANNDFILNYLIVVKKK